MTQNKTIFNLCGLYLLYLLVRGAFQYNGQPMFELVRNTAMFLMLYTVSHVTIKESLFKIIAITAILEFFCVAYPPAVIHGAVTENLTGSFGHENRLSDFYIFTFATAVLAMRLYSRKVIYILSAGISVFILVIDGSRAGLLIGLFMLCVYIIHSMRGFKNRFKPINLKSLYKMGVIVVGTIALIAAINLIGKTNIYKSGMPCSYTIHIWDVSWTLFKACPVCGIGIGMWKPAAQVMGVEQWMGHCHNEILQLLAEVGIVGFALFFIISLLVFIRSSACWYLMLPIAMYYAHSMVNCGRTIEYTVYFAVMAGMVLNKQFIELYNAKR